MEDNQFTAGITLMTGEVRTVDVEHLDEQGLRYRTEEGTAFAPWREVKAVMLATTDHMLESAGSMLDMAELLEAQQREPYDADAMRQRALGLLAEVAPRLCPNGSECPLGGTGGPAGPGTA